VRFRWSLGDGHTAFGPVVEHRYPHSGTFTAIVTASNASTTASATVPVTVVEPLDGLKVAANASAHCGRPTTLRATVLRGTALSLAWHFGDGETAEGAVATHTYAAPGAYTIVVTAANSLSEITATARIAVSDVPIRGLTARTDVPSSLGKETRLAAAPVSGTNVRYDWDLGDGTTGSGPVVTHLYPSARAYTAVVTAANSAGEVTRTVTITVAPDCLVQLGGTTYRSIQAAADASTSASDEVQVAGTCSGSSSRSGSRQLLHLTKPMTVRGGYSADFSAWDPRAYPTTLDAQGQGRVIAIDGDFTVTLEALHIINGHYEQQEGAGIRVVRAHAVISGCVIHSHVITGPGLLDGYGAGIYLYETRGTRLINNLIYSNTAQYNGGGLLAVDCQALEFVGNDVLSNTARYADGGGLYLSQCESAVVAGNTVAGNRAGRSGGGASIGDTQDLALLGNRFFRNQANGADRDHGGGGIYLRGGQQIVLHSNEIAGNQSQGNGAGVWFGTGGITELTNNVIADNRLTTSGSGAGIYDLGTDLVLTHNTFARNSGGGGQGFYAQGPLTATFTNTVLAGHAVALELRQSSYAHLDGTLWGTGAWANGTDVRADTRSRVDRGATDLGGNPRFIDPDGGGYRIGPSSDAIDRGIESQVSTDIQGETRVSNPDIGADEYRACFVRLNDEPQDYGSVQAAVDASMNVTDVVKVAGTCAGAIPRDGAQQTVYLSKTLTIRGGYNPVDWSEGDPSSPTVLDAEGDGRVVRIEGDVAPVLERLALVGGTTSEHGGGVYVVTATLRMRDCRVMSNTARTGGGIALWHAGLVMTNSVLADNTAHTSGGGGLSVVDSEAWLQHATIARNRGTSGILVAGEASDQRTGSSLQLYGAIVVSHGVAISIASDSDVTVDTVLWDAATPITIATAPMTPLILRREITGDPAFAVDGYHLTARSDAIDRISDTRVANDIDGEARPSGLGLDLGADEFWPLK
jgi:PKD repeat protein